MGFGGYQAPLRKARGIPPKGIGIDGPGSSPAAAMQNYLQRSLSRRVAQNEPHNGVYGGGYLLPRDPQWSISDFGPDQPLPREPLDPTRDDTGQQVPRLYEYPVAWNVTIGRERHVQWDVLKRSSEMPLFRACIELRKSELSSMEWGIRINPKVASRYAIASQKNKDQVASELRQKHREEIDRLEDWWQYPDRKNGRNFSEWIGLAADEQLTHDALAIYPWQTYGGDTLGLWILDGSTIMPLLDETGGRPKDGLAAYQQILYGFPRGEFTAQTFLDPDGKLLVPGGLTQAQLVYKRRTPRTTTPYGYSDTEQALLDGLLWNRRFGWMVSEYTEGTLPAAYVETSADNQWTADQLLDYERDLNNKMAGMTAERMKARLLPPGMKMIEGQTFGEKYKPDYDLFLIKLLAMHYGITASELGFPESGGLGSSGFHEGQEDILYRRIRIPDLRWFADLCTEISITYLGMNPDLEFYFLGLDSEDEAAADALAHERVADGRMTLNEARAELALSPYEFPEADMPMEQTERGVVFLEGASKLAPPGTLIEPMMEQNTIGSAAKPGVGPRTEGTAKSPQAAAKESEWQAYKKFVSKGQRNREFKFEHLTADEIEVRKALEKSKADEIYHQLTEDYPKASLGWVHNIAWDGPSIVPFSKLDMHDREHWRASHEPDRVAEFGEKIKDRLAKGKTQLKKPAVVIFEPGKKNAGLIVDGHHRTLGAEAAGEKGVYAWIGHSHTNGGPWLELHDLQFTRDSGSAPHSGDDKAADQVGKADADPKAPEPATKTWSLYTEIS